jgi:hypothetical protein
MGHSRKPAMRRNAKSGSAGGSQTTGGERYENGTDCLIIASNNFCLSEARSSFFAALHVVVNNLLCAATGKVDCKLCVVNFGHGPLPKLRM